ncbi:hypothetical protein C8039_02385 [Halogeometricum sp. wsp3]|nr:hypothetical protein C8039_02385 [Halogeometricum sp. wsp3]
MYSTVTFSPAVDDEYVVRVPEFRRRGSSAGSRRCPDGRRVRATGQSPAAVSRYLYDAVRTLKKYSEVPSTLPSSSNSRTTMNPPSEETLIRPLSGRRTRRGW